jgi:hypothetical protein
MNCRDHPAIPVLAPCSGCGVPLCASCLVTFGSQPYCVDCKGTVLMAALPSETCPEAARAFKTAIVGWFFLGVVLWPLAIVKAAEAHRRMKGNPRLTGGTLASAAIAIAVVGLALFVVVHLRGPSR